jgi:hypothetical protein
MDAKFSLGMGNVTLDVAGDSEFVRQVYESLREKILVELSVENARQSAGDNGQVPDQPQTSETPNTGRKSAKKKRPRKSTSISGEVKPEAYTPSLVKDLETNGLSEYYGQFEPKNHAEKILVFMSFLQLKGHEVCTADQIFTCYKLAKVERPKVFKQAIIDTNGKQGYIDYKSVSEIRISQIGDDHLIHRMAKSAA